MLYFVWTSRHDDTKLPIIVEAETVIVNIETFDKLFPGESCGKGGSYGFFHDKSLKEAWEEACIDEGEIYPGIPLFDEALIRSKCKYILPNNIVMHPMSEQKHALKTANGFNEARSAAWGKEGYVAREGAPFEFL